MRPTRNFREQLIVSAALSGGSSSAPADAWRRRSLHNPKQLAGRMYSLAQFAARTAQAITPSAKSIPEKLRRHLQVGPFHLLRRASG